MPRNNIRPAIRPVIIDTDPGIDDAVAILLALASPELLVLGLVAVAGNLPLAVTARNALGILELAGPPAFFSQLGKRNRRRVLLHPSSQVFDPVVVSHEAVSVEGTARRLLLARVLTGRCAG